MHEKHHKQLHTPPHHTNLTNLTNVIERSHARILPCASTHAHWNGVTRLEESYTLVRCAHAFRARQRAVYVIRASYLDVCALLLMRFTYTLRGNETYY
jgi:hypothetical protein